MRAAVSLDRFENELLLIAPRYCPHVPAPRGNIFVTIWAKLGLKSAHIYLSLIFLRFRSVKFEPLGLFLTFIGVGLFVILLKLTAVEALFRGNALDES